MYIIDVSLLFTGDNVDHNILTIDGKGKFHGMGVIAALTPKKQLGIVVSGQNPTGQNPTGQNPYGQNPTGQNPTGQNPTT